MNHDILCVMEVNEINRSNYQQPLVPKTDYHQEVKHQEVKHQEDLVERKKPQTTKIDKYV